MLVRRLLLPALAVGALGVATTGCADQAAAARVGDARVSDRDFRDALKAAADDEVFLAIFDLDQQAIEGDAPGSYRQEFVALMLNNDVSALLADQFLTDKGEELTDDELQQFEESLAGELAQGGLDLEQVDESNRERLIRVYAAITKVQSLARSEDDQRILIDLQDDVEVNSRYGSWDSLQGVVPPDGPIVPSGDGELPLDQLDLPSG